MKLPELEHILGYRFADIARLERALTHRSWVHENRIRAKDNEAFEFVGDSVLGLVVAEHLFTKNPDLEEGELTLMKHRLVSMPTLGRVAGRIGLGEHLKVGKGEERSGGRQKPAVLADTLEAIIAAVFLDGGYVAARVLIGNLFVEEFKSVSPSTSMDHKTMLQERLQSEKLTAPKYGLLRSEGPPHERTFYVEAIWQGGRSEGVGRSLKLAEMDAAKNALDAMGPIGIRG